MPVCFGGFSGELLSSDSLGPLTLGLQYVQLDSSSAVGKQLLGLPVCYHLLELVSSGFFGLF